MFLYSYTSYTSLGLQTLNIEGKPRSFSAWIWQMSYKHNSMQTDIGLCHIDKYEEVTFFRACNLAVT